MYNYSLVRLTEINQLEEIRLRAIKGKFTLSLAALEGNLVDRIVYLHH